MPRKEERDWAQLDAFEAEYAERLAQEKMRGGSAFLNLLEGLGRGSVPPESLREVEQSRDEQTRRLWALRGKIIALRRKLGLPDEPLLPPEKAFVPKSKTVSEPKSRAIKFAKDPLPPKYVYPVSFEEIKVTLAQLPPEHVQTVGEIRLSNQKNTGTDGDWLDGLIRLHCAIGEDGRRLVGRTEGTQDIERFGGALEWEGNRLYAHWPLDVYKTFVLRRVLIHEVAHGVAELPGYGDAIRRAGSLEKFCEQYAENFYRPPGPSVKLPF